MLPLIKTKTLPFCISPSCYIRSRHSTWQDAYVLALEYIWSNLCLESWTLFLFLSEQEKYNFNMCLIRIDNLAFDNIYENRRYNGTCSLINQLYLLQRYSTFAYHRIPAVPLVNTVGIYISLRGAFRSIRER